MNFHRFILSVQHIDKKSVGCEVSYKGSHFCFTYFIDDNSIVFPKQNALHNIISSNRFQFDKIIRSAIKGKIVPGVNVSCVFIDGFRFLNEADYNKVVRLDRTTDALEIDVLEKGTPGIAGLYADGSYVGKGMKSGYGGIVIRPGGNKEVYTKSFYNGSSNLMELLAVSEGLRLLKGENHVQVNTDSRYVIRGLVQWVHFWRLNNWQTAFGKEVKFLKQWKEIDHLCKGKVIEFNWIKGHSGHKEQTLCHELAKQSASRFFGPLQKYDL